MAAAVMAPPDMQTASSSSSAAPFPLIIEAVDEDDQRFEWKRTVDPSDILADLVRLWASDHGVPGNAVGLEDSEGRALNLSRPAKEELRLCRKEAALTADAGSGSADAKNGDQPIRIIAFPTEQEYMEQEGVEKAPAVDAAPKVSSEAPAHDAAPKPALEAPKVGIEAREGQKRVNLAGDARAAKCQKIAKKEETPEKARVKEESKDAKVRVEAKKEEAKKAAMPGGFGEDDAIEFLQDNPKKAGNSSYDRYEKYKVARTVREALALGAAKGDIVHDAKRGFLKRL